MHIAEDRHHLYHLKVERACKNAIEKQLQLFDIVNIPTTTMDTTQSLNRFPNRVPKGHFGRR